MSADKAKLKHDFENCLARCSGIFDYVLDENPEESSLVLRDMDKTIEELSTIWHSLISKDY